MKKVFYESKLAKVLLCMSSCHTITLGPFVFSKRKEQNITQADRNHECTHARQWIELTVLAGLILLGLVLWLDISAWWMLASGVMFYVWYGIEYLIRAMVYSVTNDGCPKGERKDAYRMVSFEREAYESEHDCNYLENCSYFTGWMKYLYK